MHTKRDNRLVDWWILPVMLLVSLLVFAGLHFAG